MPFKSVAQMRHYEKLLGDGEITEEVFLKMSEGTPDNLPERVTPAYTPLVKRGPNKFSNYVKEEKEIKPNE